VQYTTSNPDFQLFSDGLHFRQGGPATRSDSSGRCPEAIAPTPSFTLGRSPVPPAAVPAPALAVALLALPVLTKQVSTLCQHYITATTAPQLLHRSLATILNQGLTLVAKVEAQIIPTPDSGPQYFEKRSGDKYNDLRSCTL
jgi:hypothetical protein